MDKIFCFSKLGSGYTMEYKDNNNTNIDNIHRKAKFLNKVLVKRIGKI